MRVKFENVGRSNATWTALCKELTEDFLYRQVAPKCASRNLEFYLSKDDPNKGIIVAGFHEIGTFIIEDRE